MEAGRQLSGQSPIDRALSGHPALPFEGLGNKHYLEMTLRARRHRVHIALVDNLQLTGGKGLGQPSSNTPLNRTRRLLANRRQGAHCPSKSVTRHGRIHLLRPGIDAPTQIVDLSVTSRDCLFRSGLAARTMMTLKDDH